MSSVNLLRDAVVAQHLDTISRCMKAIDARIVPGQLPGNGSDKTAERNGLILAYNVLSEMLDHEKGGMRG